MYFREILAESAWARLVAELVRSLKFCGNLGNRVLMAKNLRASYCCEEYACSVERRVTGT
jgi:hypothetical protein